MATSDPTSGKIVAAFDAAAESYDSATPVQRQVARELVFRAASALKTPPKKILDLGAGSGHVTAEVLRLWPHAKVTALDAAPAMLARLNQKFPQVATLCADAQLLEGAESYDLILSSMMAHWLPDPRAALDDWRRHLAPGGLLAVALPVAGTLAEWRDLLARAGLDDGLWNFPPEDFASDYECEIEPFATVHENPAAFLRSLKAAGAQSSRAGHAPTPPARLRRLLREKPEPIQVTYHIAFIVAKA